MDLLCHRKVHYWILNLVQVSTLGITSQWLVLIVLMTLSIIVSDPDTLEKLISDLDLEFCRQTSLVTLSS